MKIIRDLGESSFSEAVGTCVDQNSLENGKKENGDILRALSCSVT